MPISESVGWLGLLTAYENRCSDVVVERPGEEMSERVEGFCWTEMFCE